MRSGGPSGGFGGFGGFGFPGFGGGADAGFDPFEAFFGRGASAARGGSNIVVDITLTFLEAAKGTRKEVSYYANVKCKPCNGTGAKPGTTRKKCPQCGGSGQVRWVEG